MKTGLALVAHKFMFGTTFGDKPKTGKFASGVAVGPYLSVLPGALEIVDVLGVGVALAVLGDSDFDGDASYSLNIGAGYFFDFKSLDLEEGFTEGQAPPDGATAVKLRERTDRGLQVVVSFSARL